MTRKQPTIWDRFDSWFVSFFVGKREAKTIVIVMLRESIKVLLKMELRKIVKELTEECECDECLAGFNKGHTKEVIRVSDLLKRLDI